MRMEKKVKTAYVCTNCGAIHPRWQGQCRECGEWNTLAEERIVRSDRKPKKVSTVKPRSFNEIDDSNLSGYKSGMDEFDRVLGGVLLPGSAVLLAGEPGIGKSTLILQAADAYSDNGWNILYVTGEESPVQIKKRSERLNVSGKNIAIANLTDLEQILSVIDDNQYHIVIVDSIQTVTSSLFDSPRGRSDRFVNRPGV